jgi:hypothetical protein
MMNEHGKSDRPIVPAKSLNKAGQPAAEGMEGRGLTKGNLPQQNASRTPSRSDAPSALERVRQAASKDKEMRFTALLHHIYNLETLRRAYLSLKKEASPGVDGETWRHYGETLEDNLQDLSHRLKRGGYRAKPVRRVYIDKSDGRKRPLRSSGTNLAARAALRRAECRSLSTLAQRSESINSPVRGQSRYSGGTALSSRWYQVSTSSRAWLSETAPRTLVNSSALMRAGSGRHP